MLKKQELQINLKNKKETLAIFNMLFNGRNDVIKFVDDYGSMILEAKRQAAEKPPKSKESKILTPKPMLRRLPIALPQVKAGNTSENLLNEIRQTIYSLYQTKEITKMTYNNIKNSIKV